MPTTAVDVSALEAGLAREWPSLLTFRLDEGLMERVWAEARRQGSEASDIVREALLEYLKMPASTSKATPVLSTTNRSLIALLRDDELTACLYAEAGSRNDNPPTMLRAALLQYLDQSEVSRSTGE